MAMKQGRRKAIGGKQDQKTLGQYPSQWVVYVWFVLQNGVDKRGAWEMTVETKGKKDCGGRREPVQDHEGGEKSVSLIP